MTRGQRGFSLLEVLIASALTIAVVLVVTGAVIGSLHATSLAAENSVLAEDATSALSDLREATAYGVATDATNAAKVDTDRPLLQKLIGHSATMMRARSANVTETITVSVAQAKAGAPIVAVATASDGTRSQTERRTLFYEAPTPGSVVTETAP